MALLSSDSLCLISREIWRNMMLIDWLTRRNLERTDWFDVDWLILQGDSVDWIYVDWLILQGDIDSPGRNSRDFGRIPEDSLYLMSEANKGNLSMASLKLVGEYGGFEGSRSTRALASSVLQITDWQTYKKFRIIWNKCTNILGMPPKNFRKISDPELEISLYLSNFSKEVSQITDWKTNNKFRIIWY